MKRALILNASALIVVHRPAMPKLAREDTETKRQLKAAAKIPGRQFVP